MTSHPLRTIRPPSGFTPLDLRELWAYRDLLTTLAFRDIMLRYRQTALGVTWVLLQPAVGAGLLTFVFGNIAGLAKGSSTAYFLLTFAGQIFYVAYAGTVTKVAASLVGNTGLVSKVYFPRLILPLSTVASSLLDFAVGFCLLALLLVFFHGVPGLPFLTLPFWIAFSLLLSLGWGLIAAALMVAYRDVQHILPVLMQFLNFGSPVGWTLDRIGEKWLPLYLLLNPLAVFIEGFRWSLYARDWSDFPVPAGYVVYAVVIALGIFSAGTMIFRNRERQFADVI
ncbi:MAG: ABC transporter permease [Fibrella sp.]|nr:ABC transporter permease [Armatimonadota bacterium]